jgi:hypothetical protein
MNDIVSGIDMALGSGWDRLETYRGESFRWVSNDAVLYVATLRRLDYQVQLQIEPGPGVGLRPFTLKVNEADGKTLASVAVKGRHHVSFTIPAGEPKVHAITLRTNEGGKPSPNDPRVLNFRVFKILTNALPGDVLAPGSGFRLGTGWYPLESFSGETFRWVNNDAIVEATAATTAPLELELEPGPGVELRPFTLNVFDGAGEQLQSFTVRGRQRVEIELPNGARPPFALRMHVEGGGKTTSQDARVMNFRVFEHSPNATNLAPPMATVTPLKPVAPLAASK